MNRQDVGNRPSTMVKEKEEVPSTASTEENVATRTAEQQREQHSRRRAMSVSEAQPNVETVIGKAKRAASSLWILLHAQTCVLPKNQCPHAGCHEAKLLHLHLKTCPAVQDFACPSHHHGCDQARKLLAHYRRCRNLRARQTSRKDPHHCLVCSLVARQARSTLQPPLKDAVDSTSTTGSAKSATKKKQGSRRDVVKVMSNEKVPSNPSPTQMPPPPPRFASAKVANISLLQSTTTTATRYESPPSAGQLKHKVPRTIAAVVGTPAIVASYPNALSRSIESAKGAMMTTQRNGVSPRGRAASVAETPANSREGSPTSWRRHCQRRERSSSLGSSPVSPKSSSTGSPGGTSCETILEEGSSDGSATKEDRSMAEELSFDMELVR